MKGTTFLKLELLLPVVAPVAALGAMFLWMLVLGTAVFEAVPEALGYFLLELLYSHFLAAVPYALFAAFAAFLLRGRSVRAHWCWRLRKSAGIWRSSPS